MTTPDPADAAPVETAAGSSPITYPVDGGAVVGAGAVNGYDVLAAVASLPISTWRYRWDPPGVRHLGPMAQDWKATFGLGGDDDTRIPVVDGQGVALVAIQALHRQLTDLQAEVDHLRGQLDRARPAGTAPAQEPVPARVTTTDREPEDDPVPDPALSSTASVGHAMGEALGLSGAAVPALQGVLAADPAAGLARAVLMHLVGADQTDEQLREQLVRAHADAAPGRERSLVRAVFLHSHRHYDQAAEHVAAHLEAYPADPVATLLVSAFTLAEGRGHRGFARRGDEIIETQRRIADAAPEPDGQDGWAWLAVAAGARAEQQGRARDALTLAEQALARAPRSGVAAHARAHALHELGAGREAVAWLDEWMAPDPGLIQRRHLQWHAALQSLAAGDLDDARRRADDELTADDVGMRSAVNWRLLLIGQTPAETVSAEHAGRLLEEPGGWVEVFHTFQLALALAVAGDQQALRALARRAHNDEREDYRHVLAPTAEALADVLAGRPGAAAAGLEPLHERLDRLGGVRVEREIVTDTLARALVEAGQPDRGAQLLHDRASRHGHTYEQQLLRTETR